MVKFSSNSYNINQKSRKFTSNPKRWIPPQTFTVKANQTKKYSLNDNQNFFEDKQKLVDYNQLLKREPELTDKKKNTANEIFIYTKLSTIEEILIGILRSNNIHPNEMNPFCCDPETRKQIFKKLKIKSYNSYALKLIDIYKEYLAKFYPNDNQLNLTQNTKIINEMTLALNNYFKNEKLGGRKRRRSSRRKRRRSTKRRR